MSELKFLLRTSWIEFKAGVSSGIVSFTFIGLSLYLALTLLNAEYMQQLGATDVTRNSATVIYLMVTGFMFFLFFAYAWIFAQPILRDRNAQLHEIVLTMPINIKTLLWGRFIGATATGTVLASSVLFGFVLAPILEWGGWLPAGSLSDIPWNLFAFVLVWLIIPSCIGIGAIYMMMTMLTRSLTGPMGAAVVLVLFWMFSATILVEGDISTKAADILDPSLFSFALAETESWTPAEKQSAYLPLSSSFLLNRALWGLLPLIVFSFAVQRIGREHLTSNSEKKVKVLKVENPKEPVAQHNKLELTSNSSSNWLYVFFKECHWQASQVINNRVIWIAMLILLCVGLSNTFIHVIWHGEGPLLPDPGMIQSALSKSLHLVIVFIVAGVVGIMCRRDHVEGISDMLDSLHSPSILRPAARAVAVTIVTTLLTLTPALTAIIATLLADPNYLDIGFAIGYQALVVLPSQIECAMVVFFVHSCIRRTGLAYGASMFVVVILIANHELELINYPPFELSIPARISFSPLTEWVPWFDYALLLATFKWLLGFTLFALAVAVMPRGKDSRLTLIKNQGFATLKSIPIAALLIGSIGLGISLSKLNTQLIEKGGYKTAANQRIEDAAKEKLWANLAKEAKFRVEGGSLKVIVDSKQRTVAGHWRLDNVTTRKGILYANAPEGMQDFSAVINGKSITATIQDELISIPTKECETASCSITFDWVVKPEGWTTTGQIPWITNRGIWANAELFAPTLGIDPDQVLRSKLHRKTHNLPSVYPVPSTLLTKAVGGIAPSGNWQWQVTLANENPLYQLDNLLSGNTQGPLEVIVFGGEKLLQESVNNVTVYGAAQTPALNKLIGEDVLKIKACVERRLNTSIDLRQIVRSPSEHQSEFAHSTMLLAEEPYWHVAEGGVGHMMRQAEIGRLLVRRYILNNYALRQSPAINLLTQGLPGAVGLLCVGDNNGVHALAEVAKRYADSTSNAMASSSAPVDSLKNDVSDGWSSHYSKLALLGWAAKQSPETLNQALSNLARELPFEQKLSLTFGKQLTTDLLGPPISTSFEWVKEQTKSFIKGEQKQWRNGGWQPVDTKVNALRISLKSSVIKVDKHTHNTDSLSNEEPLFLLNSLPAYQPSGLLIQRNKS